MSSAVIVVPCYNEANRLQTESFRQFNAERHAVKFLFINDGSTDATQTVLENLQAYDPRRFASYELQHNVGKAEAVRTGVLRALDDGSDYIGYWDADLATPLQPIPTFCDLLESRPELMIVFGARVRLLGRTIARQPIRHYLGRIFATAASLALGLAVYDTQCGAKLFRVSPEIKFLFQEPFLTKWLFDVEIIARLIQIQPRLHLPPVEDLMYEFPLDEWRDIAGSKVRPSDFLKAFFGLATIYWKYLRAA